MTVRRGALRPVGLLVLAAGLAGCGALEPFPTVPQPLRAGAASGPRVGVCYNPLSTGRPQVQAEAQRECPAGTAAQAADTDWYLQTCPLLLPGRATFICVPAK
jgi:hypothetical protein